MPTTKLARLVCLVLLSPLIRCAKARTGGKPLLVTSVVSALAIVVAACGHLALTSAIAPVPSRWLFTFEIMGGRFRTPVELVENSAGRLRANALGPPLVTFKTVSIVGERLTLEGSSRFGGVRVSGRIASDSFDGRWRIKLLSGSVTATRLRIPVASPAERLATFDALHDTLVRRYYDAAFGGVNWDSLTHVYRVSAVGARNDGEWLAIVRRMLSRLHSSHLDVAAITLADALPTRGGGASTDESQFIKWRRIDAQVGYLRIAQFDEGPAALDRLDSAFAALVGLPGLVVDVRGNPGGTLGVAMRLGDYLLPPRTPVGTFTTQTPSVVVDYSGYKVDEFLQLLRTRGAVRIMSGGRAARPYRGRVALLIDGHSGSTTEAFAGVLGELHLATLVGERTAGAMLSAAEVALPLGWVLRFPEADFRTPGGQRLEGHGVLPDVVVKRHWYRDNQLDRAVSIARQPR